MTGEARPAAPVLLKEVVPTQTLGEVVVRALKLSERLALGRPPEGMSQGLRVSLMRLSGELAETLSKTAEPAACEQIVSSALQAAIDAAPTEASISGSNVLAVDLVSARLLAMAVTDKQGVPIFSVDEWDIFGAQNQQETDSLVDVAMRLGGFIRAAAKNA